MNVNVVKNYGPIESFSLPEVWKQASYGKDPLDSRRSTTYCLPGDENIEITLYQRGMPISQPVVKILTQLLESVKSQRELSGDEIISLEEVLGNTGKNQYTLRPYLGRQPVPPFNLSSAKVVRMNGVAVILVWGNFQNDKRESGNEFYGLFVPDTGNPAMIYELFYQAPDKIKFLFHLNDFEEALRSIQWS